MNKDLILTVNNEIRLLIRDYKYAEDIVYLINKNKSFLRKTLGWIPENEYTIEDDQLVVRIPADKISEQNLVKIIRNDSIGGYVYDKSNKNLFNC